MLGLTSGSATPAATPHELILVRTGGVQVHFLGDARYEIQAHASHWSPAKGCCDPVIPGPALHADPAKSGLRYWYYSINELGIQDMDAQVGVDSCLWVC